MPTLQERITALATAIGAELQDIKATLAGLPGGGGDGDIPTDYTLDAKTTGTAPRQIASIRIAAGTHQAPRAYLLALNRMGVAVLKLRKEDGTLLATITASSTRADWYAASQGYTLTATTSVIVTLQGTLPASAVACKGLSLARRNTGFHHDD